MVTALVSAVTFFVADNFVIVEVRVFTFDFNVRLAWVMLICLLVGMALGWLFHWLWGRNRS